MSKNNIFIVIIIFLLMLIFPCFSFAQDIPYLKDVVVKEEVHLDLSSGIYTYSYTVDNSANSRGGVYLFEIDITKPTNGQDLSAEGLIIQIGINYQGIILTRSFEEEVSHFGPLLEVSLVPVGINTPLNWIGGTSLSGTVGWGSAGENDIHPGKSLSGFMIISRGLPSIRGFIVRPYLEDKYLPAPPAETEDLERYKREYEALYESISVKGKTLGPTAPPADFKPLDFLNHIISLKHEAYNLGWIIQGKDDDKGKKGDEEKGIMKSLDEKLEKAKKKLEKGDTKEAIEKLKSFIHEIEALHKEDKDEEKDKKDKEDHRHEHITSEGYALLKYNAQYLIEKLGGEKEGRKDKKD